MRKERGEKEKILFKVIKIFSNGERKKEKRKRKEKRTFDPFFAKEK